MFSKLFSFFNGSPNKVIHPDNDYAAELANIPRWPPFDNGLPYVDVQDILKTQATLIRSINDTIKSPIVDEAILNFIKYVHLLPATKEQNHCGAGGLFRLGLEIAYHSVRASQGKIFTAGETPDIRNLTEPKWRLAAFLAGLCCETYRAMSGMVVTSNDGQKWPSLSLPLNHWLEMNNHQRYYIRWIATNHSHNQSQAQTMSAYVANQIIPLSATSAISTEFNEIAVALMATINGSGLDHPNPLTTLVQDMRMRVIEKDINSDNRSFGKAIVGMHLEPYILTTMRKLVANSTWTANTKSSRIWIDKNGVYLVWKTAFQELYSNLDRDILKGVPNDMDILAEMLVQSGVFIKDEVHNSNYYLIYPPTSTNSYSAVKLSTFDILFNMDMQSTIEKVDKNLLFPNPIIEKPTPNPIKNESIISEVEQIPTSKSIDSNGQIIPELDVLSKEPILTHQNKNLNALLVTQLDSPKEEVIKPVNHHDGVTTPPTPKDLIKQINPKFMVTPTQKAHLQKLDQKFANFLEKVMAHNFPSEDNQPLGFVYTFEKSNLYAIPLDVVDDHDLDRVNFVQALHTNGFAWMEPTKTRRIYPIQNPINKKTTTCLVLNKVTSKLLGFVPND